MTHVDSNIKKENSINRYEVTRNDFTMWLPYPDPVYPNRRILRVWHDSLTVENCTSDSPMPKPKSQETSIGSITHIPTPCPYEYQTSGPAASTPPRPPSSYPFAQSNLPNTATPPSSPASPTPQAPTASASAEVAVRLLARERHQGGVMEVRSRRERFRSGRFWEGSMVGRRQILLCMGRGGLKTSMFCLDLGFTRSTDGRGNRDVETLAAEEEFD